MVTKELRKRTNRGRGREGQEKGGLWKEEETERNKRNKEKKAKEKERKK